MRKILSTLSPVLVGAILLTGCLKDERVELPPPGKLTIESSGYFCGMEVASHPGPKAQMHLIGKSEPIWFSAVRDMFGYLMLPGENKEIAALYVSDMAKLQDWQSVGDGPWIDPRTAFFVIGSDRRGGMGALETVPFSTVEAAEAFADTHGGRVVPFGDVPSAYIFDTEVSLEDVSPQDGTSTQ